MDEQQSQKSSGGISFLVRISWFAVIPVALFFIFVYIVKEHSQFPSLLDAVYWVLVLALSAIRYIDVRYFWGETGEGKPATMKDWRRFSILVAAVSLPAWVLAHILAWARVI
jgi:hypothetical protein